jgi:hypothetical protein
MPEGATDRVTFEDIETTARTVEMVREARFLFCLRGGGDHPEISQGGYSTSVSASAGTHAKDALDFKTRFFSLTRSKLWEWCVWEVGFASWRRTAIIRLWVAHTHSLPKEGDLSDAAKRQIKQWFQGDDALKSDKDYPRILSSGFVARTWESYQTGRPHGHIALVPVVAAFQAGKPIRNSNDIVQIQKALNHFLDSKLLIDGVPGPSTRGVYKTYQARLYGGDVVSDGIPGNDSLANLGFTVTP